MSFEWQTEDERSWEQPAGVEGHDKGPQWRRWVWVLFFVVLIGAGLYLGWQQVQERVEAGAEVVREEVRASYLLAERAAEARDQELFITFLSGRSATWTDSQVTRLQEGLLFAESGRVIGFQADGLSRSEAEVTLNAELTEAMLSVRQPFLVDAGAGLQETVALTQTHVFRRGDDQWLLAPPTEEFWGAWQTRNGRTLQMVYPQHDEEIALRLHDDLERKLMEMCRSLVECPADFSVLLRLETDVQSVVAMARSEERLQGGREVIVPTPSLIGEPVDETAYAALFRGYARYVVSGALVELQEYVCCRMATYQEALLDWQLSRLSLGSAPLRPETYLEAGSWILGVNYLAELSNVSQPRTTDEAAPIEVHAFIDFLRSRLAMRRDPLGDIQLALSTTNGFWQWVQVLTEYEPTNPFMLEEAWREFVWEKAREASPLAVQIPSERLPQQDIIALCGDQTLDVYRYSIADGVWSQAMALGVEEGLLAALPGGDGYVVTSPLPDKPLPEDAVTLVSRTGEAPFPLLEWGVESGVLVPTNQYTPDGRRQILWLIPSEEQNQDLSMQVALLDSAACTAEDCPLEVLPGYPIWSPDGELMLALNMSGADGVRVSGEGIDRELPGMTNLAFSPFWIDDEHVGFVTYDSNGRHLLAAINVYTEERVDLLTPDALAEGAGESARLDTFGFSFVTRNSSHSSPLVIGASAVGRNGPRSYLFALAADQLRARLQSDQDGSSSSESPAPLSLSLLQTFNSHLSPVDWMGTRPPLAGRYLSFHTYRAGVNQLTLFNLETSEVVFQGTLQEPSLFVPAGGWTTDEAWLMAAAPYGFYLYSPPQGGEDEGLEMMIFHEFERCQLPAWVN